MTRIAFILVWILVALFVAGFAEGIMFFALALADKFIGSELLQYNRLTHLVRMIVPPAFGLIALWLGIRGRLPETSRKVIQ